MNLVFIYGPPAVGKLAVAKELEKLTGYKLFHNHVTSDFLTQYIQFGTDIFFRTIEKVRLAVFEAAAKENVDLIFTGAYTKYPENDKFVREVVEKVEAAGGRVCFIQLVCDKKILLERVNAVSRRKHKKVKDPQLLLDLLKKHDYFAKIPVGESFTIDNTKLSPKKVAEMIKEHYNF